MSNLIEKRSFDGGMNTDDALENIAPEDFLNGFNFRGGTYESGQVSGLQPIPGTLALFKAPPSDAGLPDWVIGGCDDEQRRRILYFVASDGIGYIGCWDIQARKGYVVLSDQNVTGGLRLDRFHPVHSSFVLNGILYWTDNLNEPRRINIDAGISLNDPLALPRDAIVVNNVPSTAGGFLQNLYSFDTDFFYITPGRLSVMGPGINMLLRRTGTGGPGAATTNLFVPIDWSTFPTDPYWTILGNALTAYFTSLDPTGANWNVTVIPVSSNFSRIQVDIKQDWDWGTGDPLYAPTASVELHLFQQKVPAYISPVQQPVITWIRRPPGVPPTQSKVFQEAPVVHNNFIDKGAFQFCYRYAYREYELSTLSGLSTTALYNAAGDRSNRIDVTIPLSEAIAQDVIRIDLVAVYLNSGQYFIIKSWDIEDNVDHKAIIDHNSGNTPLSYSFYNNQVGIAIDPAYSVKPFDSVPILSETVDRAKNRAFLGHNTSGYDTPSITSLTAVPKVAPSISSNSGEWFFLKYRITQNVGGTTTSFDNSVYIIYIVNPAIPYGAGYFTTRIGIDPQGPPFPGSVDYTLLTYRGFTIYDVMSTAADGTPFNTFGYPTSFTQLQYTDQSVSSTVTNLPGGGSDINNRIFKSGGTYKLAITFYDNNQRKCGALTNPSVFISIDETKYNTTTNVPSINWTLSNGNPTAEIPEFAYYYSIDITKCLTTRFFIQARPKNASYVTKDADGNYLFTTSAYDNGLLGCAFDITSLDSFQMGYVFNEGDILKIYRDILVSPDLYFLKIVGQQGKWLITELADLGLLDTTSTLLFEIYTPFQQSADEPYYEQGFMYQVSNPGTDSRAYGVLNGAIAGDVTIIVRNDGTNNYVTENMSPNDKFWKVWNTDAGRPNFVDRIGQVVDSSSVKYSNVLVQGGKTNGLSTFDALDSIDLPVELGAIRKLELTSKIQKEGTVMLAVCESEIVSLYMGETQVASPQGNAFLSVSSNVIGTIYPLKGSFGTSDPMSIQQWKGNVYGYDSFNGVVWQYSDNGLEPISRYKLRTFWRNWSAVYRNLTAEQIAALGSQPYVVGGIDPFNGEYLLSIPKILADNPNGLLPGYTDPVPNLFNPMDGEAKTMVFKIDENRWKPCCSFAAETLVHSGDQLYGFNNSTIYLHNDLGSPFAVFYGTQYPCVVMFGNGHFPSSVKILNALNVESDLAPDTTVVLNEYPWTQISDIVGNEWRDVEGVFYAPVKNNRVDPRYVDPDLALSFGEKMRSKASKFQLSFFTTQHFQLKYVNIGYKVSAGHRTIPSK